MTVIGIVGIVACTIILSGMVFCAGFAIGMMMSEEDRKINNIIERGQRTEYERLVNKLDIIDNRVGMVETRLDMLDNDRYFGEVSE